MNEQDAAPRPTTGYFVLVAFPLVVIDPAVGGGPLMAPAVLSWLLAMLGGAAHAAVLALDRRAGRPASSTRVSD